ncbi:unnamed protein product [Brugia timori]|uniref:F5/8 type C domain-containing protein n=1 Tax=Brugia timori TaxID=42155 RepID=A0A0R3QZT1_9BILA|nr:unnamed protein product [Brugia timori]
MLNVVYVLAEAECQIIALGMENGDIEDSQLSASTSFDMISVGPQNARRQTIDVDRWTLDVYKLLQVNFEQIYVITGIETQGRYGNGTGREYTTHYTIEYLRLNSSWIKYHNEELIEIFNGNDDTSTAVRQNFIPPIIASKIRIIPYSNYARTMCLRVEFYGCIYNGLVFCFYLFF